MPLYTVTCQRSLPEPIKQAVADSITQTHCEVTKAPPEFVNVIFMDGYLLKSGWSLAVVGGVRSGGNRSLELIKNLTQTLQTQISQAANLPVKKVGVELLGVNASWVMEGGKILPEPGQEQDWFNSSP